MPRSPLTALPAWQALTAHAAQVREMHLRSLFATDAPLGPIAKTIAASNDQVG